jgi:protein TonB
MYLRLPIAVGLGLLTTFGLFWVMQALIGAGGELREGRSSPKLEFVRLKRESAPETKKREAPRRQKPEQQPPPPEMNLAQNIDPGGAIGDIVPLADPGSELAEAAAVGTGAGSDRDVVPLVRVDPEYPPRARQRGIEGYVDLEFTIAPTGVVENPRVIGANPRDIFDDAALRAVRRWRYNPRLENGVAVSRTGIRVRLLFEMEGR